MPYPSNSQRGGISYPACLPVCQEHGSGKAGCTDAIQCDLSGLAVSMQRWQGNTTRNLWEGFHPPWGSSGLP